MLALLIGAAKSGTSWFWAICNKHPQFAKGEVHAKEPRFWTKFYKRGLAWYRHICPYHLPNRVSLDASPDIFTRLYHTIPRIQRSGVDPTIVLLLREPVSRLFSHWRFHRQPYRRPPQTNLPFDEYVELDLERIRRVGITPQYNNHDCKKEGCRVPHGAHVVALGAYAVFLKPWLDAFGDRMVVYFFEDLISRPKEIMGDFFGRHGLSSKIEDKWLKSSRFTSPFKADRQPKVEAKLRDLYRPYNEQLRELLGRELPVNWKY